MQLILVMETRKSCNSDYRYIKTTIDYFYKPRSYSIKPVYAKTKSELLNQEKKINDERSKYNGESIVAVCADYDRPDDLLNEQLIKYCTNKAFELIWMNRNIEHVYLDQAIVADKEKMSRTFLKNADFILSALTNLNNNSPIKCMRSSNILCVLDKYLERK